MWLTVNFIILVLPQEVKIASMTLEVCYANGECSESEIQIEPKQCSGAFLETKKSREFVR